MSQRGITKTLVLPDIHTPHHHRPSIDAILDFIRYWKPDNFVQLGDFCDFNSLGSFDLHNEEEFITLDDELASANQLLDEFDKCLPKKCKKYMVGGNHEDRYHKVKAKFLCPPDRITKALLSWQKSWAHEYRLHERKNWQWVEYGDYFHIGKIIFTHGWATGPNACSDLAKRFPGRNCIFGHCHSHLVSGFMDEAGLPIEIESIGTLSNFNLSYLRGKPPYNWTRGFSMIYTYPNGEFTKSFIHIVNSKFIVNGRSFSG